MGETTDDTAAQAPGVRRPDAEVGRPDLAALEATVRRAVDERRPDLLTLVGNGEFSIALRWDEGDTAWVAKRVPPFPSRRLAEDYVAVTREYMDVLAARGVRLVSTALEVLDRPGGSAVVYHVQPLLHGPELVDQVLRRTWPSADDPLVRTVVDHTVRVLSPGDVGFDAQFANWYRFEGELWQLDFSTPLLLDARGRVRFDITGFAREYPVPVRPLVVRELLRLAPSYVDLHFVLHDLLAQLHRQDLVAWCDAVVTYTREAHGIELSVERAAARCAEEAAFFPRLLRLKRLQRGWVQRTGRRYDTLLPATTSFGR